MTELERLEKINELFELLSGYGTIIPYTEPKNEVTLAQSEAMAKLYADRYVREFLLDKANTITRGVALHADSLFSIGVGRGRILQIQELIGVGKKAFEQFERLRVRNLKEGGNKYATDIKREEN